MNVRPWCDTPFDDDDAFADFTLVLGLAHERIAQVMFANSLFYKTYPLMDWKPENRDTIQNLQQELGSIFGLLNLSGLPDFSGVDLKKQDEFEDFMLQLQQVETTINAQLGIV